MKDIFENWNEAKSLILEGLSPRKQAIVSTLLDNQRQQILSESVAGTGSTSANDIANFRKSLLPMVRRIIPGTIATEIVGVQPMSGPVGQVFSMRYRYADSVTGDAARDPFSLGGTDNEFTTGDEVFGNLKTIKHFYSSSKSGNAIANAGDYGVGDAVSGLPGDAVDGQGWDSEISQTANFGPYADPAGYFRSVTGSLHGGSGSTLEGSFGRRVTLDVTSQSVSAATRRLQANWTIEAMQDLQSQHGLNMEREMTTGVSAQIVNEIDYEIISDLVALAGTAATFDGAATGTYGFGGAGNYSPSFIGDRLANLGVLINRVANEIGAKTRKGVGNFMVVSPLMVSILQSAAKSVFAPAIEGSFKGPTNTMLVGTLNGQIKVYSYAWNRAGVGVDLGMGASSANDKILIGYKGGNAENDAGYFYCPYIPLTSTSVITHPTTGQQVISLSTRYGKAVFTDTRTSLGNSADYYGKIQVTNLDLR